MAGKILGGNLADMADAKREKQPRQRDLSALLDGLEQACGTFLAPALAVLQLRQLAGAVTVLQGEDVGGFGDPAVAEQFLDQLGAQPLDVEGGARDEMAQLLDRLRRADQPAGAAADRIALFPNGGRAAFRAGGREGIGSASEGRLARSTSATLGITSPAR